MAGDGAEGADQEEGFMLRHFTVAAAMLAAVLVLPAGRTFAAQAGAQFANTPVPCLGVNGGFGDNCGPALQNRNYVNCRAARHILRDRGYRHVEVVTCGGRFHQFAAWKGGHAFLVTVSARSGRIVSIRRLWA